MYQEVLLRDESTAVADDFLIESWWAVLLFDQEVVVEVGICDDPSDCWSSHA